MIYVGLLALLLVCNVLIPIAICLIWPRDADVGCWFCCGILLTQLSSTIVLLKWNRFSWERRFLFGTTIMLAIVLSAWISFRIPFPVGPQDNAAMLTLTIGFACVFLIADLAWWSSCRWQLSSPSIATPLPTDDSIKFSLSSMLITTTLCAGLAALAHWGSSTTQADIRDIRSYAAFPWGYLALMTLYLWSLHTLFLVIVLGTNRPKRSFPPFADDHGSSGRSWLGWGLWVATLLALGVGGLEAMRRLQEILTHARLDYLNWEFAMVALGFATGHLVAGYFLRWQGYRIQRVTLPPLNN